MASLFGWLRPGHLGTEADRDLPHPPHGVARRAAIRSGLTEASATRAIRYLQELLGTPAVALTYTERPLAWDGRFSHHAKQAAGLAAPVVADSATSISDKSDIPATTTAARSAASSSAR